jgi:hypothetical protein
MRSLRWRSWTRQAPLAPRLMPLALMRDSAMQPHFSPSSASSPHLSHLSLSVQGLRPNLWVERRGGTRAGDGGMDKATRSATARARGVDRGEGGGECGAREVGEGGSGGPRRQQRVSEAKYGRRGGEGRASRSRSRTASVQRPGSNIEIQSGEVFAAPRCLGFGMRVRVRKAPL